MYLYFGYLAVAVCIGLILGMSNSPVAGVFITAFFGLLGTVIGAQYLFDKSNSLPISQKGIAVGLILVSVGLLTGIVSGETYRNGGFKGVEKVESSFPWEGLEKPNNTYEALDWIHVQEKLKGLGYKKEQIKQIYEIRISERSNLESKVQSEVEQGVVTYEATKVYESTQPFHKFLSEKRSASSGGVKRGLASE